LPFLSGSLALGLLALEFGVRRFMPYFDPRNRVVCRLNEEGLLLGVPSMTYRHGVPKGEFFVTVAFNHYGFRDSKDFLQASTNDIFVVGDSQTYGFGVEESNRFSTRLEQEVNTPVFNIAMPSNDFQGYGRLLAFAERHGGHVRNLIIGVCMENDLLDYSKAGDAPPDDDPGARPRPVRGRILLWLKSRSPLFLCCLATVHKNAFLRRLSERAGMARGIEDSTRANQDDPQILAASRDALLKIARPYDTVVLIIPSRVLWHGRHVEIEQKVHTHFVQMLREAGLGVVDLLPVFERSGAPLRNYFERDPHLNSQGHAAAAAALADYLRTADQWSFLNHRPPAVGK